MLLSNIIGKKIVNISTALDLGAVCNFTYHDGAIEYIVTDTGMAVKTSDIDSLSDIITCNMHYEYSELEYALLSIKDIDICSIKGKSLGTLQDMLINDEFIVKKLITDVKNIIRFRIVSYSLTTLVIDKPTVTDKNIKKVELSIPTVVSNYSFLLDRTLFRNIMTSNGQVLISRGERITQDDIDKARRLGKLVQLTLYSTPIR